MWTLKRIDVFSAAKFTAVWYAIFGFLMGIFFTLIFAAARPMMTATTGVNPFLFPAAMGALSILVFPVMMGILGFVFGAVGAWLYNIVAGWIGGVEFEMKQQGVIERAMKRKR